MSKEFASAEMTAGQLNAIVKKLGGYDGAMKFLRDELSVSERICYFTEEDGVITFTLPATDGTTGKEWIARLEKKGNRIGNYARQLLLSSDFKPTTGKAYTMKVLKGEIFSDNNRTTKNIREEAKKRKFQTPNPEMACLIRENFTDEELKEMGLVWVVVMHEPIKDADGDLELLSVHRDLGGQWLGANCGGPDYGWYREGGFAFSAQQD